MKRLLFMIFALAFSVFLTQCGRGDRGRDGRDGDAGEAGNPGAPGNPGESIPGQVGEEGKPGQDAIVKEITCSFKWDLAGAPAGRFYKISYSVLRTNVESAFASLQTSYTASTGTINDAPLMVLWTKASGKAEAAPIQATLWNVSLVSDTVAKIERAPTKEVKEVPCQ